MPERKINFIILLNLVLVVGFVASMMAALFMYSKVKPEFYRSKTQANAYINGIHKELDRIKGEYNRLNGRIDSIQNQLLFLRLRQTNDLKNYSVESKIPGHDNPYETAGNVAAPEQPLERIESSGQIPYIRATDDYYAAHIIAKEIRERFPVAKSPQELSVLAAFWLYNRYYIPGEGVPSSIAENIYSYNHQQCGARSDQLSMVLSVFGIKCRMIGIGGLKHRMKGHTAVEAFIDGRWIFLDPTLGFIIGKMGGDDFAQYRLLSFEEAVEERESSIPLMFRCLFSFGPYDSPQFKLYEGIFGTDPYNCRIEDVSSIVSTKVPDSAFVRLNEFGTLSCLDVLADNTSVLYSYKTDFTHRAPDTICTTVDLTWLTENPVGEKNQSFKDVRNAAYNGGDLFTAFYFVGKYLTYYNQWQHCVRHKVTVTNIVDPGTLVISFYKLNGGAGTLRYLRRDVEIEVSECSDKDPPRVVVRRKVKADEIDGEFVIPVTTGADTRVYMIELKPELFGLEASAVFFDAIRFIPTS